MIPESGRFSWRRAWQPISVFLLENPMDRGAWQATVHGVTKSQIQLKWLSTHTELHRAGVRGHEGGMVSRTRIRMSTFFGVTVDLGPYRYICTTSHGLETPSGST